MEHPYWTQRYEIRKYGVSNPYVEPYIIHAQACEMANQPSFELVCKRFVDSFNCLNNNVLNWGMKKILN